VQEVVREQWKALGKVVSVLGFEKGFGSQVPYLVAMHPSSLVLRPASPHCRTDFGS
jgi:hypothetical protein